MMSRLVQLVTRFVRSLSFKLSFYAGLILFVALLTFAFQSIRAQELNLVNKMIQEALKDSEVIKAAIWNGMMTKNRDVIRQIVGAIGTQGGFDTVDIYDSLGILRYSSAPEKVGKRADLETDPLLRNLATDTAARHRMSDDRKWLEVVNPLLNTQSCSTGACHADPATRKVLGALTIRLPLLGVQEEIQRNARRTTIFAAFLFVFISTIIGLAVIFLVNPNLRRLQENAAKMARGEYEPRTPSDGSDEIAELSRTFDEMSREINERTQQLGASRKMYKALFEDVPCYLTVVDRDYRIARANRAFIDQFGPDKIGMHCFVGYKSLDCKCPECPVEKTFADGQSHQSEERWSLNGQEAYVIVKTGAVHDDEGNITGVLEMSLDVTKLKSLQMELRKRQREYKYLFEHVPCYLTVIDRDSNIIQANTLFREAFGDHSGKKCFKAYKNKDVKCSDCPVDKTFEDGLSHQSEEVWIRDGQESYVIVNTAPVIGESGEVRAVMEMSIDITEVKRLQGELAVLGETIAGMSHTIKNILGGLQGGVYVVDSGLNQDRHDKVRTGWDMVKRNVEKVSELVKGILYASKEREPEYQDCDPKQILGDVCDLYEDKAKAEGVDFIRDFDEDLGRCFLDPAGIHSALSNLISNAFDACRWAGEGRRFIKVSGTVRNDNLILKIKDNGKGMPEEVKEKLFNRFYSTKGSGGTGLGLVLTRKVIREHGGTIRVKSQPGRGTSFTMEIPIRREDSEDNLKEAV